MPIDLINSDSDFDTLRKNWDSVYRSDTEAQWFLSWSWLKQLSIRRKQPITVLAYRRRSTDATYSAFFPVRRQARVRKNPPSVSTVYRLPGNYWADYTGLICEPAHEREAIVAFCDYLQSLPWQRLYLENLRISSHRLDLLLEQFDNMEYSIRHTRFGGNSSKVDLSKAPYIRLPENFESYLTQSLGANTRQRIRRYRRKMEVEAGTEIRLSTEQTQQTDLSVFEQLWRRRWQSVKGSSVGKLARRYRLIIQQGLDAGDMIMPVFVHRDKVVGVNACYIDKTRRSVLFFVAARDLSCTQLPVGLLLHAWTIERAIIDGNQEYDFLRGDEPYKYSLGASDHLLKTVVVDSQRENLRIDTSDNLFIEQSLRKIHRYQRKENADVVTALYKQLLVYFPENAAIMQSRKTWEQNC